MDVIEKWIREGGGVEEGLRLLALYGPNHRLERMVKSRPEKYRPLLVRTFRRMLLSWKEEEKYSFRREWPFLDDPDCPSELKILAADKITAMRSWAREHEALFSSGTIEECLEHAKNCVESFSRNRKILSEFNYYKEHGTVLGKHRIFADEKRMEGLRTMDLVSLKSRRDNLARSIRRLRSQVAKGDRPDLDGERSALIAAHVKELAEVDKIIDNYRKAYGTDDRK